MSFTRSVVLSLTLALVGCGGGEGAALPEGKTGAEQLAQQNIDQIKAKLQPIADSGVMSASSIYGMDAAFKAAGKEALIDDLNKLMKTKKPDEIKKLAKELIGKL